MISMEQAEKANDWIRDNARHYAQAKANRIYLEEFRKSKKAILVQQAKGTNLDRESYAYAHEDYIEVLEGIKAAVEQEEELRWKMVAAQAKLDLWRTQESSRRAGI